MSRGQGADRDCRHGSRSRSHPPTHPPTCERPPSRFVDTDHQVETLAALPLGYMCESPVAGKGEGRRRGPKIGSSMNESYYSVSGCSLGVRSTSARRSRRSILLCSWVSGMEVTSLGSNGSEDRVCYIIHPTQATPNCGISTQIFQSCGVLHRGNEGSSSVTGGGGAATLSHLLWSSPACKPSSWTRRRRRPRLSVLEPVSAAGFWGRWRRMMSLKTPLGP